MDHIKKALLGPTPTPSQDHERCDLIYWAFVETCRQIGSKNAQQAHLLLRMWHAFNIH